MFGTFQNNIIWGLYLGTTLAGRWCNQTPCVHVEVEATDHSTSAIKFDPCLSVGGGFYSRDYTDIRYEITDSGVALLQIWFQHEAQKVACWPWPADCSMVKDGGIYLQFEVRRCWLNHWGGCCVYQGSGVARNRMFLCGVEVGIGFSRTLEVGVGVGVGFFIQLRHRKSNCIIFYIVLPS